MSENVIFFGWNQGIPGREKMSVDHFGEFVEFLTCDYSCKNRTNPGEFLLPPHIHYPYSSPGFT